MVNKFASVVLSCLLLVCAPLAQAGMLKFDDLEFAGSTAGASILNSPTNYGGFTWDGNFSVGSVDESGSAAEPGSKNQFLFSKSNLGPNFFISRATPFDFLGATFLSQYTGFSTTEVIYFKGFDQPGPNAVASTRTQRYFLDSQSSTLVKPALTGIYKLQINIGGGTFAMDNFSFRDSGVEVTEAGSLALLAIGLFGLWAARRRSQMQA